MQTEFQIETRACECGQTLPLLPVGNGADPSHKYFGRNVPDLSVGTRICTKADIAELIVTGKIWLPGKPATRALLLQALQPIKTQEKHIVTAVRTGVAIACITLSDKGFSGEREDKSGPKLAELLTQTLDPCFVQNYILPDDAHALRGLLADLALIQGYDVICTSGGTGLGPRDITPQVTESLLDLRLPGFCQAMMAASLAKTPRGAISRAACGVIGNCIVINLPGSLRAVEENIAPLLPAMEHAFKKLHGDKEDCGG